MPYVSPNRTESQTFAWHQPVMLQSAETTVSYCFKPTFHR
ncbi:hypothetical protein PAMC26510_05425 [Caballeronia sordidicola]|uniref:Uncharacterized protein n=1 Tax=Caballeronia sordidicola TaxID=196367 RepID=A0A242N7W2_CABSO|nr:hypothetical protein PAMC26510_05425 [Caballeronia sordidicola]